MAYADIEQILLGYTDIWNKMFNCQDNIGFLHSKWSSAKKQPLFVKELFKSDHLEWCCGTKCWILKITKGLHNINTVKNSGQKVQPKYGSGARSRSRDDPLIIISYGQTYMWPEPVLEQILIPCKNVQPKYGSRAGSGSRDDIPQIQLCWDIDGTRARLDPKFRSKSTT